MMRRQPEREQSVAPEAEEAPLKLKLKLPKGAGEPAEGSGSLRARSVKSGALVSDAGVCHLCGLPVRICRQHASLHNAPEGRG